jgi:hypothetical protein
LLNFKLRHCPEAELNGCSDAVSGYGYPAEATNKGDIYIREIFSEVVPDERAIGWIFWEPEKPGVNIMTEQ